MDTNTTFSAKEQIILNVSIPNFDLKIKFMAKHMTHYSSPEIPTFISIEFQHEIMLKTFNI